jgi:hypothetical protein
VTNNDELTPELSRVLRGSILKLLRARHNTQLSRMDDVALTHALISLAFRVDVRAVVTLLQDMQQRGYVRYDQRRDSITLRVRVEKIELLPMGRDIVEENIPAPAAVEL